MADILEVQCNAEDIFGMDWYDPTCYASEIMDAKYGKVSTDDVEINSLIWHLTKKMTLKACSMALLSYSMVL